MCVLRVSGVSAILLAMGVATLVAQAPTFRSGVDLITVDATVLAADGSPIDHLASEDFVLRVDGAPRRVVSAQFVPQSAPSTRPRPLAASHFTSNEQATDGRVVVVAVDEAHIRRLEGKQALRAAGAFIDRLDGADRIGVVGLAQLGTIDFTTDRVALKRKLDTLMGHTDPVFLQFNLGLSEALEIADGSRMRLADAVLRECGRALTEYLNQNRAADEAGGRDACPEQLEQEARAVAQHAHTQARISLGALEALLVSLQYIPGPKTLVLLTEGLVADPRRVDFGRVAAAAQTSRASIYVLQLEVPTFEAANERVSPTFSRDLQVRSDGLSQLAGSARGARFRLLGNDPRPFERIAREMSGYYLLAFEPTDTDRDGRAHRIQVSLARGRGEVRARPAFTLPAVAPSARAREERLVALLRASDVSTELPLRVATYTYPEPDSAQMRVVVSTEVGSAGGPAGRVLAGFVLVDSGGVIAASGTQDIESGRYAFSALVPPGSYSLRVAAIDPMGRHGSVHRPFLARVITAEGVSVSDLMLAPVPTRAEDALEPSIDRIAGETMLAYVELRSIEDRRLDAVNVRVEITAPDRGHALVTVPAEVISRDARWGIARAVLPTGRLSAGRYVARADVISVDRVIAQVVRPFSK